MDILVDILLLCRSNQCLSISQLGRDNNDLIETFTFGDNAVARTYIRLMHSSGSLPKRPYYQLISLQVNKVKLNRCYIIDTKSSV